MAEVRIPFSQLRFKPQDVIEWRLNVGREVARSQEEIIWSPVPKKYGGKAKYRTEDLGRLRGLEEIASSRNFEVLPYLLSGLAQVEDNLKDQKIEPVFELGGDLKYSLTADLTYNTDFAQVEADQKYVNLSCFSLFFPEKRPFFLEGSNFFEFGISGSNLSRSPTPAPNFTAETLESNRGG